MIGTNKHDAAQTIASLLEDARAGRLPTSTDRAGSLPITGTPMGVEAWTAIDEHERRLGAAQQRPRVKVTNLSQPTEIATR